MLFAFSDAARTGFILIITFISSVQGEFIHSTPDKSHLVTSFFALTPLLISTLYYEPSRAGLIPSSDIGVNRQLN